MITDTISHNTWPASAYSVYTGVGQEDVQAKTGLQAEWSWLQHFCVAIFDSWGWLFWASSRLLSPIVSVLSYDPSFSLQVLELK